MEQIKDIKNCKRKMPTYLQRKSHQNYINPLSRNPEIHESME
jgi:hypothetical protein